VRKGIDTAADKAADMLEKKAVEIMKMRASSALGGTAPHVSSRCL
jgi:hypothetical protein